MALRGWPMLAIALCAAFTGWTLALGAPDFPLDDAYITLNNASVVLDGYDSNYGVSPLIGATSAAHLALVAALATVVSLPWAGALAAWIAAAAYAAGLLLLAQRCSLTRAETVLLLLIGVFAGLTAPHLMNGLETGLAMAVVIWALLLAMGPPGPVLPVLLGLMPFVRPELAILAAILFADQACRRWRAGQRHAIAVDGAIAALAAAPWLSWMWMETGALVPQTAGAKRFFFAQESLPWDSKLWVVADAVGRLFRQVGPLAIAMIGLRTRRVGRLALLFAVIMLALFAQHFPGGLNHNGQRYLYLFVPLLLVGFAFALQAATQTERSWLGGLGLATIAYAAAWAPTSLGTYASHIEFSRNELAGVAKWVTENLPADARIAVHDAGYIAYATDRTLIDVVGLKTPQSRDIHGRITAPSAGRRRGEALARILVESNADYLIVWTGWDDDFGLIESMRDAGAVLEAVRDEGEYRVYRTVPPSS
jgi:hypothetical protein